MLVERLGPKGTDAAIGTPLYQIVVHAVLFDFVCCTEDRSNGVETKRRVQKQNSVS